jgi:hypothetical protein
MSLTAYGVYVPRLAIGDQVSVPRDHHRALGARGGGDDPVHRSRGGVPGKVADAIKNAGGMGARRKPGNASNSQAVSQMAAQVSSRTDRPWVAANWRTPRQVSSARPRTARADITTLNTLRPHLQ